MSKDNNASDFVRRMFENVCHIRWNLAAARLLLLVNRLIADYAENLDISDKQLERSVEIPMQH